MTDKRDGKRPDWAIDPKAPVHALTLEAQASLRQLAVLSAGCKTFRDLLPLSEQVDALVQVAVAGGANEHHIATELRLDLRDADKLAQGQPFHQFF